MLRMREVLLSDAERTLNWRKDPRVNQQMLSDFNGDLETQKGWIESAYARPDYYHWIFEDEHRALGLVSLSMINISERTASWGIYLGEPSASGAGLVATNLLYRQVFLVFGLHTLFADVLESNRAVCRMHELMGYVRVPERDVRVTGTTRSVGLLGYKLSRAQWERRATDLSLAPFPIHLWRGCPFEKTNGYR